MTDRRPSDPMRDPWGEVIANRPTLTNEGRAAIGLPVVNDLVLVPVLDIPMRADRPADRPTNEGV